jgi:perosamine synthetase
MMVGPDGEQAVLEVLRRGWLTTGPEVAQFESELADWLGCAHVVAVSSCTAALELALRGLGLPQGARVLTPTLTFCGAVHAILHAGYEPVLVDVDEDTLVMSVDDCRRAALEFGASALMVQHMSGYPAPVRQLAEAAGLPLDRVVEDAAHGLGGWLDDIPIGRSSRAACFSFYATKNLPLGEGGAVATDDDALAANLRRARLHGMSADAWRRYEPGAGWQYDVERPGLKANMTDLTAALGRVQLRSLSRWQARREQIAGRYRDLLNNVPGLVLPATPKRGRHAWHLYVIRVTSDFPMSRDVLARRLALDGIGTSVHFTPVHRFSYSGQDSWPFPKRDLPTADRVFSQVLSLPMHPHLSDEQVERVCAAITSYARANTLDIRGAHELSSR